MVLWVAIAGLFAWLGFEVLLRPPGEARSWRGGEDLDRSTRLLLLSFFLALSLDASLSILGVGLAPSALRRAACAVLVIGLGLRAWSMIVLGGSYRRRLVVTERQALIRNGPYRIIRHPGYAGTLLVWIGFGLGAGSWAGALLTAVSLGIAYGYRILEEERMLRARLGAAYESYQSATWRLIPWLF
jgi:protein-S-isoprenylcysteine O-methyltransferase